MHAWEPQNILSDQWGMGKRVDHHKLFSPPTRVDPLVHMVIDDASSIIYLELSYSLFQGRCYLGRQIEFVCIYK